MFVTNTNINQYWKMLNIRKTNFKKDIKTIWQKIIQVNDWHVYFISGMTTDIKQSATKRCYCFDIRYRKITRVADILQSRSGFGVCYIKEKIYVCGGIIVSQNRKLRSCEIYSTVKDQWSEFVDLPEDLTNSVATQFESRFVYVIGRSGQLIEQFMTRLYRIDTLAVNQQWETLQISQNNEVYSLSQIGLFNKTEYFQETYNNSRSFHDFMIFGGITQNATNFQSFYNKSSYFYSIKSKSYSILDAQNFDKVHQSSFNESLKVEILKSQDELEIGDNFYFNQWIQLENKRSCKSWFLTGKLAGHFVNFSDNQDSSQAQFGCNKKMGYEKLWD
eukprot:403346888